MDGLLRSGRSVHARCQRCMMGWMDCSSMPALPWKLPMQELVRTINYWSVAISHVHLARQFKLSRSRQHMLQYLGNALSRCTECTSNRWFGVAAHELSCC